MTRADDLRAALGQHRRVELTRTPTPLQHLPHLSDDLGIELWIKRDDLTDLAGGGDKPRKLEYEVAAALDDGADTLVTCGSSQSNMARLTTAAARRFGLDCTVVLSNDEYATDQGNLLLVRLMGADVRIVDVADHWDLDDAVERTLEELRSRGRRPHFIPVSGTTPRSCLGYVSGGLELFQQLADVDVRPDVIYTPCGTGGILAGASVAADALGATVPFVGVSVNRDAETCMANVERWRAAANDLLGLAHGPMPDIDVTDRQVGREYGDPTPACLDAIVTMATSEGVLLDPVYSGKVAAGLFAAARAGEIEPGSTAVMIHSGGVPALHAYADDLLRHIPNR